MIEALMSILTGGALGSITGLLGTLITKWDESRKRQADTEQHARAARARVQRRLRQ